MTESKKQDITVLLNQMEHGNSSSHDEIIEILYQELHLIAARLINKEQASITFQATELVSEAYMRLFDGDNLNWQNRKHFLSTAVVVMRRFLVDHARKKSAKKRIPQNIQFTLNDVLHTEDSKEVDIIKLDDALSTLEHLDAKQANIVGLRFFVGLTDQEISELYGVSRASINLEWQTAKLWLLQEMQA